MAGNQLLFEDASPESSTSDGYVREHPAARDATSSINITASITVLYFPEYVRYLSYLFTSDGGRASPEWHTGV